MIDKVNSETNQVKSSIPNKNHSSGERIESLDSHVASSGEATPRWSGTQPAFVAGEKGAPEKLWINLDDAEWHLTPVTNAFNVKYFRFDVVRDFTDQLAQEIAQKVIGEFAGCLLVPDGYSHEQFFSKRMSDVISLVLNAPPLNAPERETETTTSR